MPLAYIITELLFVEVWPVSSQKWRNDKRVHKGGPLEKKKKRKERRKFIITSLL